MTDYLWNGPEATVASAIYEADGKTLKSGYSVIGPRTLDGISYVNLRTDATLTLPAGLSVTGKQLSEALIGTWAPATTDATVTSDTSAEATAQATTAYATATPATADTTTAGTATAAATHAAS